MSQCPYHDAFKEDRRQGPVLPAEMDGETIPMLLRHKDVRRAAKDYRTYSSDAPFRVPIPSEEDVRSIRQLPIETDPPEHSDETVFEAPGEIRLDRKPNPHVAFGSGAHTCLGAHHARLIVRTLLTELATRIARIEVLDARPAAPSDANYRRAVGYDHLQVRFVGV